MTARWMALGWAWCLSLGLIGMITVSGWAFIGHIQTRADGVEGTGPGPGSGGGTRESFAFSEFSLPEAPASPGGEAARAAGSYGPPFEETTLAAVMPGTADPESAEARRIDPGEAPPEVRVRSEARHDVRDGDSLYEIFLARGLSAQELHYIVSTGDRVSDRLSRLRPGDVLRFQTDGAGSVRTLSHFRAGADALRVEVQPAGHYAARWTPDPVAKAASRVETPATSPPAAGAAGALDLGLARHQWTRRDVRVSDGDSLYGIFLAQELAVAELIDLLHAGEDAQALKRLLPDQKLEIYLDAQRSVRHLVYHPDAVESLHFFRHGDGFASERYRAELDRRLSNANGEIRDSFYLSAQRAGLSDRLIMETAEIFGWDIDFALDIRAGDRFAVIYEEFYQPDGTMSEGAILAAEFVNRSRTIRALRYEEDNGAAQYYSPEGFSMRKAFLRAPLDFTRISSRYGMRKHPVLHKLRHHDGVDYAAPRGTPVRATGAGKVVFAGRKGGYGKTVMLKHGNLYTTLYSHLSRYAKGLKRGSRVQQGQIIGYVGSTGLSTGPHLHYEFRVRERHRDPLKVELPDAPPIAQEYKADFLEQTRDLVARLEHLSRTHLASTH